MEGGRDYKHPRGYPRMNDKPKPIFDRSDWILEKMEEAFVCIIELNNRVKQLESYVQNRRAII